MNRQTVLTVLVVSMALAGRASAQQAAQNVEEQAVLGITDAYVSAFERRDSAAVAQLWTEDGDYVDSLGQRVSGRPAIAEEFQKLFASLPAEAKLQFKVDSVQFPTPDVAIEDGTSEVMLTPVTPPLKTRFTAVQVRRDGKWFIRTVREIAAVTDTGLPALVVSRERLEPLAWLIGDWTEQQAGLNVESSSRWCLNGNFIIREFDVKSGEQVVLMATQWIGWDPQSHQIKSWMFDSEGGQAEGYWTREGDDWVVRNRGVLRDGRAATSTNVYSNITANGFQWRTKDRCVGGQQVDDRELAEVKRRANP